MARSTALKGRILAIDDDRELLANFSACLELDGHKVVTADKLSEGLRLAATQPFHVCLLDRSIGRDSGLDALPRFRELAPAMRSASFMRALREASRTPPAVDSRSRLSMRSSRRRVSSCRATAMRSWSGEQGLTR